MIFNVAMSSYLTLICILGVEVKAGQSVKVDPNDQCTGYIHISQVRICLCYFHIMVLLSLLVI